MHLFSYNNEITQVFQHHTRDTQANYISDPNIFILLQNNYPADYKKRILFVALFRSNIGTSSRSKNWTLLLETKECGTIIWRKHSLKGKY
jgi:hypothetical protein